MDVTWGEIKKAIDEELDDDAKIKKISVTELYYKGITVCYDRKKNAYVVINKENE